jgi:RNA polymerase-binding transcription factor DksA
MPLKRRETIQLARAIEERREALLAEIRQEVARTRDEPFAALAGATPDSGDEALADLIADVGEAEVTRDLAELRRLEAARKRIAEGSYGRCVDCGADIPVERLRAELDAERCIGCQQRHEKTYRT